jgi:hypothetical protein
MVYLTRYISYFFVRVCGDNSLACSISICEAVCPGKPYHYHLNSKAVFLNKSSKLLGMVHGEANLASSISQTACTWSPKSPSPSISVAAADGAHTKFSPLYSLLLPALVTTSAPVTFSCRDRLHSSRSIYDLYAMQ